MVSGSNKGVFWRILPLAGSTRVTPLPSARASLPPTRTASKGAAKPVAEDPYNVDGLSGATITSRGVGALLRFWLEEDRFGAYLANFRNQSLTGGQG